MAKIIGTTAANTLKGKSTADDIYGNAGHDKLFGFGGDDELNGGTGNDWLQGGTGNDELNGGAGLDTFVFSSGRDEIDDFSTRDDKIVIDSKLGIKSFADLMKKAKVVDGGEDVRFDFGRGNTLTLEDTKLSSLKASHFSFKNVDTAEPKDPLSGDNTINGNSNANTISGGGGNDKIKGNGGNDRLNGDSGNDKLYGGDDHDELDGGTGNDYLSGGTGNDELDGGAGDDRLDGGSGINELEGGTGRDTFVFTAGKTEIDDFNPIYDTIELSKSLGATKFADLAKFARTADGGQDLVLDFGANELRLEDTKLSQLSASDFLFV